MRSNWSPNALELVSNVKNKNNVSTKLCLYYSQRYANLLHFTVKYRVFISISNLFINYNMPTLSPNILAHQNPELTEGKVPY